MASKCNTVIIKHVEFDILNVVEIESTHFTITVTDEKLIFNTVVSDCDFSSEDELLASEIVDQIKILCDISKQASTIINYLKKLGCTLVYKICAVKNKFGKFIFPVLRRVFPNLIAHELVSVQPMNAPTGAIFSLEYLNASSKSGTAAAGDIFPCDQNQE